MLQNNTINKFQHFPFHLVDPSSKFIHTTGWAKPTAILYSNINKSSETNLDSPMSSPSSSPSPSSSSTPISTPAPTSTCNTHNAATKVDENLISSSDSLQQTVSTKPVAATPKVAAPKTGVVAAAAKGAAATDKTATANFLKQFSNISIAASRWNLAATIFVYTTSFNIIIFIYYILFKYLIDFDGYFVYGAVISFLLYYFVVDKFNYSQNKYLAFLQKVIFKTTLLIIMAYILLIAGILFEMIPTIECSSGENDNFISKELISNQQATATGEVASSTASQRQDILNIQTESATSNATDATKEEQVIIKINKKALEKAADAAVGISKEFLDRALPQFAVASVASTTVATVFKATPNLPIVPRILATAAAAGTVSATTTLGINVAKSFAKNTGLSIQIENSKHSNPDPDVIPSPDDDMIRCPLENGDLISPLEELLTAQLSLNVLSFFLIFIIIYIVLSMFLYNKNINFLSKFLPLPAKLKEKFTNLLERGAKFNTKFMLVLLILCSINLIVIVLINIFVSVELTYNTEDYVTVYNHIKNKKDSASFLIYILTVTSQNKLSIMNSKPSCRWLSPTARLDQLTRLISCQRSRCC
jgi:hypothetical protein